MRSRFRNLMILSLIATIGSFTIDLWPILKDYGSSLYEAVAPTPVTAQLGRPRESTGERDAQAGTARICVLTILLCGAGIGVIRIIRASKLNR